MTVGLALSTNAEAMVEAVVAAARDGTQHNFNDQRRAQRDCGDEAFVASRC
ncbi:hypothetical protein [Actinoplanes sp. ATCC 53533]|uniref:hypothetical protein n=1 Tax=Actinoplanes sp. ATCC 53533 TaxID=1288362 RepID=UPI0013159643|nr:hypothetical protein [Actinoplanes sp. ATCC 53533]